jgi:hypothetical protein
VSPNPLLWEEEPTDEVLRCLTDARARLVVNWCRYSYEHNGKHCAQGAVLAASGDWATYDAAREAVIAAMPPAWVHPKHRNISLMLWNDKQDSAEPVLALFDRAIAARRGELS